MLLVAFDFASGGMLPCLMPVYLYMFVTGAILKGGQGTTRARKIPEKM